PRVAGGRGLPGRRAAGCLHATHRISGDGEGGEKALLKVPRRSPKLTWQQVALGAIVIGIVAAIVELGLLPYSAISRGVPDLYSFRLRLAVAAVVLLGLVYLLAEYYGDRRFWR